MKPILFIIAIICFTSCEITKSASKEKQDRTLTEATEVITKRVGDTVTYEVPRVVYRDTTIVKRNYVTGTTQVVRYDRNGGIDLECISGEINRIERSNKELIEAILSKESEKTEELKASTILYLFLGLAIFIVIVGGAFMYVVRKQGAQISQIVDTLGKAVN